MPAASWLAIEGHPMSAGTFAKSRQNDSSSYSGFEKKVLRNCCFLGSSVSSSEFHCSNTMSTRWILCLCWNPYNWWRGLIWYEHFSDWSRLSAAQWVWSSNPTCCAIEAIGKWVAWSEIAWEAQLTWSQDIGWNTWIVYDCVLSPVDFLGGN